MSEALITEEDVRPLLEMLEAVKDARRLYIESGQMFEDVCSTLDLFYAKYPRE